LLLPKNQAEPVKHLGQFWISTYPLSGSVFGQRQQPKELHRYESRYLDVRAEEAAHRQRIAAEHERAVNYQPQGNAEFAIALACPDS